MNTETDTDNNTDPRTAYLGLIEGVAAEIIRNCRRAARCDIEQHIHEAADGWNDDETVCVHSPNRDAVFSALGEVSGDSWAAIFGAASYFAVRHDIIDALCEGDDDEFDPNDRDTWIIEVWSYDGEVEDTEIKIAELSDGSVTVALRGDIDKDWEESGLVVALRDIGIWLDSDEDDTDPEAFAHEGAVYEAIRSTLTARIAAKAGA